MHKLERVVIYTGLGLAIAMGLGWQLSSTASAGSGQLAPEPPRIATCDVLLLVDKALLSERYYPTRAAKATELNERLAPAGEEKMAAEAPLVRMTDRDSPEFKEAYKVWVPKKQAFDKLDQELRNEFDLFNTAQAVEAYRLICEAAAAYAKNNGYTHVIATRSTLALQSKISSGVVQEANSRPVIVGPAGDDITEVLAKEMKIDVPAPGAVPAEKVGETPSTPVDPAEKAKEDAKKKVEQDEAAKSGGQTPPK